MKKAILVTWASDGKTEIYANLKAFTNKHPGYSYSTITNHLTRYDQPFKDDTIIIERKEVIK